MKAVASVAVKLLIRAAKGEVCARSVGLRILGKTMNNDYTQIDEMTEDEVIHHCANMVCQPNEDRVEALAGWMISRLIDWKLSFVMNRYPNKWQIWNNVQTQDAPWCFDSETFPRAFLKAAQALGKWSPPKPKMPDLGWEYYIDDKANIHHYYPGYSPPIGQKLIRVTVTPYKGEE